MFHYWAYGMCVASEIELPELLPIEIQTPDCIVKVGPTPAKLEGKDVIDKGHIQISPSQFLLDLPNCRYYAKEGNEITLEIKDAADDKSLRLFLLTNGLAAILHQRNKVLLHAGAIQTDKGLIVICGASGAGKSTTLHYLKQNGYQVFADDVLVLDEGNNDTINAYASYPILKLWDDSIEKLGIDTISEEQKLREHVAKYRFSIKENFSTKAEPIYAIFQLQKNEEVQWPTITTLSGFNAFTAVHLQLYRTALLNTAEKNKRSFAVISKIIEKTPIYQITRPSITNTLEAIKNLIESRIDH